MRLTTDALNAMVFVTYLQISEPSITGFVIYSNEIKGLRKDLASWHRCCHFQGGLAFTCAEPRKSVLTFLKE